MSSIKIYNNENVDSGKVVLQFSADWCNPCKVVKGIIQELIEGFPDVEFYYIDCDLPENSGIATRFAVRSIPNLVFLKDGNEVASTVGSVPKEKIKECLDELK